MPTGIPKNGINKRWFKKGIHPKTEFKKGYIHSHRGTHIQTNTGKTHFKEGHIGNKYWLGKTGEDSGHWKGGMVKDKRGYVSVYQPKHPNATSNGYVLRSHLVMEKKIGRYIEVQEVVHHNEDKGDDFIENLVLFPSQSEHIKFHHLLIKQ